MNAYLNNLMKMVNKVRRIKDEQNKHKYTNDIIAYALFLYYSGYISESDFNAIFSKMPVDSFITMYLKEKQETINNLLNNNELLNDFYYKNLLPYSAYKLEPKDNLNSNKNIEQYFINFLKYMNCYDLYGDIVNKNRISYKSPVLHGSICIGNKSNSYVIINENDGIYRYISLVHELAHALENKTLKARRQYFDVPYASEIMSITFNRIFLEYLKENNALTKDELNSIKVNFEINCHRFLEWTFLITEAVKDNNFTISDYNIMILIDGFYAKRCLSDHNYSLGAVFSTSLLNMWRKGDQRFISDIPSMSFYLNNMSLQELIAFFSKYNDFENELQKTLIKK